MQNWRTTYWNLFNTLGRVVGVCFALVGLGFAVSGIMQRDWLVLGIGSVVAVLGVLLVVARPYRSPGA